MPVLSTVQCLLCGPYTHRADRFENARKSYTIIFYCAAKKKFPFAVFFFVVDRAKIRKIMSKGILSNLKRTRA